MTYKSICTRIEIHQDKLPEVYEWAKELNNRKDEVIETLKEEGVQIESVFLDKVNDQYFLVYYMYLEDEKKAKEVVAKSIHSIDAYHKMFKKNVWIKVNKLEPLIDINSL